MRLLLVLALCAASPSVTRAGDAVRLTLADAVADLRHQSPELLAASLRVRAAGGDLTTARLLPNPRLSLGVGNLPLGRTNPAGLDAGDTVTNQVGLEQELVLWGKRAARIAAATGKRAEAEAERRDLERTLTFEVETRFVAVQVAEERLRVARRNLDQYRETVRVSRARMRAGDVAPSEVDKIALEQRAFEREVGQGEIERSEAVSALLPLLGIDATDIEPVGDVQVPAARDDTETLVANALDRRPDLQAATLAVDAADASLRLARAGRYPDPTINVQYGHSQFTVSGDLANQVGAGVSLPLPVFDRNQGEVERAAAEALIARHDLDKLRLEVPQEVRAAVTSFRVARARLADLEGTYMRAAREAREAATVSYREGAISLLEFLEAERAFLQTQDQHLEALRDACDAAFAIERAAALEVVS